MQASVINQQYTEALADKTSYEFRNISQTFCDEVRLIIFVVCCCFVGTGIAVIPVCPIVSSIQGR